MKNKLMKRITCAAMSVMLVSTLLLAGCGSGDGRNDTGADSGQETGEETGSSTKETETGDEASGEPLLPKAAAMNLWIHIYLVRD